MTLNFNRVLEVVMFVQNFIKLSAAVRELSCPATFWAYLAMVKNRKIRSCDLEIQHVSCCCQGTCSCTISSS